MSPPNPRTSRTPPYTDDCGTFAGWGALLTLLAALAALTVGVLGCSGSRAAPERPAARVVAAGGRPRVVLSAEARRRLGIATAPVRRAGGADAAVAIPFSALLYDPRGRPFTFVSAGPRSYARRRIRVADIAGGRATLSRGPQPGARVVTVGAAELLGTLQGVQEQ
jgi:hypothetical protein